MPIIKILWIEMLLDSRQLLAPKQRWLTALVLTRVLPALLVDQNNLLAARRFAALLAVPSTARYAAPQPTVRFLVERRQKCFG